MKYKQSVRYRPTRRRSSGPNQVAVDAKGRPETAEHIPLLLGAAAKLVPQRAKELPLPQNPR